MSPQLNRRGAVAALTGAGLVITALLSAPGAQAGASSPTPRPTPVPASGIPSAKAIAATRVADAAGSRAAGAYYDGRADTMIVNVTRRSSFAAVRAVGATPRLVRFTNGQLVHVTKELATKATIPGTAWSIDVRGNRVSVTADRTVSAAEMAKLRSVTSRFPARTRVVRTPGVLRPFISGGQAIYISSYRCSLGFNVRSGTTYYFLTAGHCTNLGSSWYADGAHTQYLGSTVGSSFPTNDYGIVKYASGVTHSGTVYLYGGGTQDITSAAKAIVGESVKRSGSTTGVHSGTVQALNATVNYSQGTVYGLVKTNVCAEGGDSGGSLFDGTKALGLTSGGSGSCTTGGTTYFQPVTEPLSVYGVSVY